MKRILTERLEVKKNNTSKNIIKISLSLVLIAFVFDMSLNSIFQIVKPASAAGSLTGVAILPTNNIVNTRSNYVIIFTTATSATINAIEMDFPNGFDVSGATRVIERSGIGPGSLSLDGTQKLIYRLDSPDQVPAGTKIKLEIGRVVNSDIPCSCGVTISTLDTANSIIDQVLSPSFPIKALDGNDISTGFMIRKTLNDDAAGNTRGWNPDGSTKAYAISDPDISSAVGSEFVTVTVRSGNPVFCTAPGADTGLFVVYCDSAPGNSAELDYIITKLPRHDLSSSLSSSPHTSALPDAAYINRQDDIASEFP